MDENSSQVVIDISRIGMLLPTGGIRLRRTSNLLATLGKQRKQRNSLKLLIILGKLKQSGKIQP
jgi:hypothetical protein